MLRVPVSQPEPLPILTLPTAHKVHYFQLVALAEHGLVPQLAADDLAVQFGGDAIGFHPKPLHKLGERERVRKLTFVAVQDYLHF